MKKYLRRTLVVAALTNGLLPPTAFAVETPFLISRRSESIRQAWNNVNQLIAENAKLESPLPDPLFARADLWASVGNHEEALNDYLDATKLLIAGGANLAEQSRALARLTEALERLSRQPRPDHLYESQVAFSVGIRHFEEGHPGLAEPFFAEAVRLTPDDPVYRAYRALALRDLRRPEQAARQIAVARGLLREPLQAFEPNRQFYVRLQRIQGSSRQWLETEMEAVSSAMSVPPVREANELLKSYRSAETVDRPVSR